MLKIDRTNYTTASLDDWAENFWDIYGGQDMTLGLNEVWSEVVRDATKVEEAIREDRLDQLLDALAHTFCWIACFVEKLRLDHTVPASFKIDESKMSQIVWFKYPRACATCFEPGCQCPTRRRLDKPTKGQMREFLARSRAAAGSPPTTLGQWEGMFTAIYGGAHFIKDIKELVAHYLEEMGEVVSAIRNLALPLVPADPSKLREFQEDLIEEVADTISWTFSLARKVQQDVDRVSQAVQHLYRDRQTIVLPPIPLAEVLWATYKLPQKDGLGCPKCGESPCNQTKCRVGPRVFIAQGN